MISIRKAIRRVTVMFVGATFAASALPVQAQTPTVYTEANKLILAPRAFASLGPDLFGDTVNLYGGNLEFTQTDVSLVGNNSLPVAIGRRLSTGSWANSTGAFGRWELEIPRVHGIFSNAGWVTKAGNNNRCTEFGAPVGAVGLGGGSAFSADEFWHGNFLYVPGVGDQEMLARSSTNPYVPTSGGPYPIVTKAFWSISCLTSLNNDPNGILGQGFLAVSPDGTQYRFDQLVTRAYEGISRGDELSPVVTSGMKVAATSDMTIGPGDPAPDMATCCGLARQEVWILPTRITDRYGNYVTYTYNPTKPGNLTSIVASDGRSLTMTYVTDTFGDRISTVFDGTRTWYYGYHAANEQYDLDSVTLPDGSRWNFADTAGLLSRWRYPGDGTCDELNTPDVLSMSGTMVHPSGATGKFTLTPVQHGRSQTYRFCRGDTVSGYPMYPYKWHTFSLTTKTLYGANMPETTWTYNYGPDNGSWEGCSGCPETVTTTVTDPIGRQTHHTFGNHFQLNEGELVSVDTDGLRTVASHYYESPLVVGSSDQKRGDSVMRAKLRPVDVRTTTQQGVNFIWNATSFDEKARPTNVTRTSSLGTRGEATVYFDQTDKWILGQVQSVTASPTGKVMVSNVYNPATGNLESISKFGLVKQTMTYNADGTVATRSDPLGHTTTLSNYKRGIPRDVLRADTTTEHAEVDDIGNVTSITDANKNITVLGYDNGMRRLASITPPADTGIAWNPTYITFAPMPATEFGIPAGYWRQEVTTGNARTSTYLDALWRPIQTVMYDITAPLIQTQVIAKSYDADGRTIFASYPRTDMSKLNEGVRSDYDALGRLTFSRADSELGELVTSFTYANAFTKIQTDPNGHSSSSTFQAFDTPSEEAVTGSVTSVEPNDTLTVSIARDIFGKPLSVTRSGTGVSATRSYVYDGNERLCKTIEPETGAEIVAYDSADNVTWRAPGLALTSGTCDPTSVASSAQISFLYDTMNRLLSTSYGEGATPITRTYWPDGRPKTVVSGGATWTMNYYNRGLPTTQVLSFGGQTYTLSTSYDSNGHVSQLNYPSENNPISTRSVTYAPDAFGRPTQVGTFATNIHYHPSGAVAGFTYGNGIVRTMDQNLRGLPALSADAGIMQDRYTYDRNGNVTSIADELPSATGSRTLGYDALNRLTTANAPAMWGSANFTYDVLDNIRTSNVGSRASNYQYGTRNLLDNLSSTSPGRAFPYTYDARGNVTSRGSQVFVFDQGNRLISAPNRDSYLYDGFGRRVQTSAVDGKVTVSVYSPDGQLLYTRSSGGPNPPASTQYVYLNRHQIAEVKR